MAGRYLNRFVGAKRSLLLLNKSSSSAGRPHNHLIRLLGTTTTSSSRLFCIYRLSGIVEGNLSRRAMSTLGAQSVAVLLSSEDDVYEGKPAPAAIEGSQNIANYERSPSYDSIYFSVDDVDINNQYAELDEDLLEEKLPVMCRILRSGEWSLLQRYCCSKEEIVDVNVALESELVAMCVWFLFVDVPTIVKEGVVWGLKDICFRTSEAAATNMHINDKERVTHALPDFCFDDETVMGLDETANALVVDALCSKNEEVLRQVCSILGFISTCRRYQTSNFGNSIQKKLIQLSRNYDSPMLAHVLFAVNRISMFSKGMREKMVEAEYSDGLLRRILRRGHCDFSLEAEAYYTVHTIARGHCNDELWKYLMEHLMPAVIDRCIVCDINVKRAGAHVISTFIAQASPCCIKELIDLGVLKTLICLLTSEDATIKGYCFKAVETILSLGDADPSKNVYAKMIDDLTKDWQVFYVNNPAQKYKDLADIGSAIVKTYRHTSTQHGVKNRLVYPAWPKEYLGGW